MRIRGKLFPALTLLILLFSLGGVTTSGAADKSDIAPWDGEIPFRSAWLRDRLPPDALIYMRAPHPLGFFAAPKGNVMDSALRSTANIESMLRIQDALVENVLEFIPGFEQPYVLSLAKHLRSPLEVAVLLDPAPSVILSMNLALDSAAGLEQLVEAFSFGGASLSLLEPLDTDGFGQIIGLPVPASLHFDAHTGQVLIQTGPAVAAAQFSLMVESLAETQAHKMHAIEQQIDVSGYGFFAWVDAENALPAAQGFMNEEQLTDLQEAGLDSVRALAFGWGSANGKGRMSLIVDMPADGNRKFLPYIDNELSAMSVGEPDVVFTMSIPTAEEFSRIEALILDVSTEEERSAWLDGKAEIEAETGITIENVLGAIGPEVIGIFDQAGDYLAIRMRDERLFDEFIRQVSAVMESEPEQKRYKRKTIYGWSFVSDISSLSEDEAEVLGPFAFIFARQSERLFWYQDEEFLYMSSLPQPLIERIDANPDTNIQEWLTNTQRLDLTSSLIGMTGSSDKLPRRLYYLYIESLQALADISGAEFDLWAMPTASQAGLPDKGALGFSINLGDPYLSMEMMFENNPLESIFSGDMTSIVVVGIVAAIAIPAYQDYTIRAQISQGLNEAAGAKAAVAEHFASEGEFPGAVASAEINSASTPGEYTESIAIIAGRGIIVISYNEDTTPNGGQVFLVPVADGDTITWTCSGTVVNKHLPAVCRDDAVPELDSGGA